MSLADKLEHLAKLALPSPWTMEEHLVNILIIETAEEEIYKRKDIAQLSTSRNRLGAESAAKLIVLLRNNLPEILAALRKEPSK